MFEHLENLEKQHEAKRAAEHEAKVGHQTAPVALHDWATKNEVNLAPVSHILNGTVDDFEKLDSLIQAINLGGVEQPAALGRVPNPNPVPENATAYSSQQFKKDMTQQADRDKVATEIAQPYTPAPAFPGEFTQQFSTIQQASRNLRTKFQALRVK